ncbi:S53 family peptidase [Phaeacidiphilus oryzae]|uniref:S53 family peptidase n=1 Tax=Phaeacidiphilus oryzae TaxID=348818 RepID=UPI00055BE320|nr:S53 family peptidase [Phaeacidiphilus oryzae]
MRRTRPLLAAACSLALATAGALSLGFSTAGTTAATAVAATGGKTAAAVEVRPDLHQVPGASFADPPTTAQCESSYQIACYGARQVEEAYGLPQLYQRGYQGQGQTIVIVDAFGSQTIRGDLAVFDKAYGLPDPQLSIIQPAGKVVYQDDWAGETTLDVEYAHAIAPKAKIVLVETPTDETEGTAGFPEIVKAEEYVIKHHLGGVISQSFSATEETFPSKGSLLGLRSAYIDAARAGVTVLAASGDNGATSQQLDGTDLYTYPVVGWPSSDPLVTGIGGTQLHLDAAGNHTTPDSAWSGSGGGVSSVFSRPWYQDGVRADTGGSRGVPDVSMSGACDGAVDVYQSSAGKPGRWELICGTSEATPEFAGIVALAEQYGHHRLGLINPALYRMSATKAPGVVPVTSGNNTATFTQGGKTYTVQGYSAKAGYSLVTGVGTVWAPSFVPELARAAR